MKIVAFNILKMIGFIDSLEQFCHQIGIRNHGAARIHQKQQFYSILTGFFHDNLKHTSIVAGLVNGTINIQLRLGNVQTCGVLTQLSESRHKLPVINDLIMSEVTILSGTDNFKSTLTTGSASDADTADKIFF